MQAGEERTMALSGKRDFSRQGREFTFQILFLVLFLLPATVIAQETQAVELPNEAASTLRPIELGMTQGEVRERWGSPHTIYLPSFQETDFAKLEDHDWGVHALKLLSDAFRRKTAKNDYNVRVYYGPDRRRDQDLPEIRVIRIELKPAKPLPLLPTLKDLPEAFELCREGCEIWGYRIGPSAMVFPQNPTLLQRRTAEQIAYKWKPMPPEKRDNRLDRTPVVDLSFEEFSGDENRGVHDIRWFERPVERIWITTTIPRRFLELDKQTEALVNNARPPLPEWLRRRWAPNYLKLGTFPEGDK